MKEKLEGLGQSLKSRVAELQQAMEKDFAEVKKMLAKLQEEIQSFKRGKQLSATMQSLHVA